MPRHRPENCVNILISSAGRRVGLIECFRSSINRLGFDPSKLIAADACNTAPATQVADRSALVPRCSDPEFLASLRQLCQEHEVQLLVPTIDSELALLARHRDEFATLGTRIWISCEETIEICADKRLTNRWLRDNGFPTVQQYDEAEALRTLGGQAAVPLISKPARGSASVGLTRVSSTAELKAAQLPSDAVVETIAPGVEYTVHVWANIRGTATCAVPCQRLEVRAGEVSKGRTAKHRGLMSLAEQIVDALPNCRGPINVQIFLDESGEMNVIEINPRFGGGYPLVEHAGASFTSQMLGDTTRLTDDWTDGLTMLRFDSAVYVPPQK